MPGPLSYLDIRPTLTPEQEDEFASMSPEEVQATMRAHDDAARADAMARRSRARARLTHTPPSRFETEGPLLPESFDIGEAKHEDPETAYIGGTSFDASDPAGLSFGATMARREAMTPSQRIMSDIPAESGDRGAPQSASLGSNVIGLGQAFGVPDAARSAVDWTSEHIPGADAALSLQYDPVALGMSALPFSDEAVASVDAAQSGLPLSNRLREWDQIRSSAEARSPGSATVGQLGQALVLQGFLPVPAALRAPVTPSTTATRAIVQSALRGGLEGAELGALHGLDYSSAHPTGDVADLVSGRTPWAASQLPASLQRNTLDTMRDAALMGGAGAVIGGGTGVAQTGLRRLLTRRGVTPQATGRASAISRAIETSDSAPDESEILSYYNPSIPEDTLLDAPPPSYHAASMPELPTGRPDASELLPDTPLSVDQVLSDPFRVDPDIARLRALGLHDRAQIRAANNVFGVRGLSQRADLYGIMREGEVGDESVFLERARALRDYTGQHLQEFADRASREGVAIDADGVADELDALAAARRRIRDADANSIADSIQAQADLIRGERVITPERIDTLVDELSPMRGQSPTILEARPMGLEVGIAQQPRNMATRPRGIRFGGRGAPPPEAEVFEGTLPYSPHDPPVDMPTAEMDAIEAELIPAAEGSGSRRIVRPTPMIPWDEHQQIMRYQAGRNAAVYNGSAVNPNAAQRAGTEIYRALNRARDRAVLNRFGPEELARYRTMRDAYATAATIAPPGRVPNAAMSQPTLSRRIGMAAGASSGSSLGGEAGTAVGGAIGGTAVGGAIGGPIGAAVGGIAGGIAGHGAASLTRRYEYSVLAALNSSSHGSLSEAGTDVFGQLTRRLMGRPAYAGIQAGTEEGALAAREIAERIGDEDVIQLADEGLNIVGKLRRLPAIVRRVEERLQQDPMAFGQWSGTLRRAIGIDGGVRRTATIAALLEIFRESPEAAIQIEESVDPSFDEAESAYAETHDAPAYPAQEPSAPDASFEEAEEEYAEEREQLEQERKRGDR